MTAQISDGVTYQGRRYSLAGVKGAGLFAPEALGLRVVATSSANWRGFYCTYEVRDGRLELAELHIGLAARERVDILGVAPKEPGVYVNMRAPIIFTGGMLIGSDFIRAMYVHMGFHPSYKYRLVHELIFEDGRLVSATDQSDVMEKVRAGLASKPLQPGAGAGRAEIEEWIKGTFSLDYW